HVAVESALEVGYRHFDSAQIYENEKFLGDSLQDAYSSGTGITREDLFVTTKLWNENQLFNDVIPSFDESLDNLQMDYVDLFLVHFPVTETRRPAWHKMEEIYASGRAKAIGVSNYTIKHLEELLNECNIIPAINQIELHVYLQQQELREYCTQNGIVIEAYSPLAHGNQIDNPVLSEIARQYGKTNAQVMIKWCAQNGMIVLPKSVTPERIAQNIDVFDFELSQDDLAKIAGLEKNFRTCWDPTNVA
ncbi:MAG TPA: aldo/keto reductase, partial [Acidimicrobiia bacterium]|nr:aldo/keto reductase [Acidimicrobiia bacterium]